MNSESKNRSENKKSMITSALAPAAIRVIESYRPKEERLFEDSLALAFLPASWRIIMELMRLPGIGTAVLALRERQVPGAIGNILCRTRFIDDTLRDALEEGDSEKRDSEETNFEQVVIFGAGFDSRAYRVPAIGKTRVFEVDHPATQSRKRASLDRILGTFPSHVTFVPIDFNRQKLEDAMKKAGFCEGKKTFFIMEGVTQYITEEAVDSTFRYVSRVSAPGSRIVFTYIHRGIIDGSSRSGVDEKFFSVARRMGMPWIFGLNPEEVERYLAARDFLVVEHVGASDYRERYLKPLGRRMNIFEGERVVLARVEGNKLVGTGNS